ncbi:MAG: thiamine phosphate synthase [Rikenellaceae bacterium]|nr:thiamine phosphate synthase [Rikenellaceae bacterium]
MGNLRREALELYLVTDRSLSLGRSLLDIVSAAIRGGVTMVQLREKECSTREFVALGRAVHDLLHSAGIPLIINDRSDIARVIGAEGLHIGQHDMEYADARHLLGPEAIIGLSVENEEQARACLSLDGLDYIGASPVFSTPTKTDTAPALGLEGLRRVRNIVGTALPMVAIGGIKLSNIQDIIHSGADGVAVVSAICSAQNPTEATASLLDAVKKVKG